MKKHKEKYILKSSHSPVSGLDTYSVFKDDELVFMIDGDRVSLFEQDEVESITLSSNSSCRVYRVGDWVFTGSLEETDELKTLVGEGFDFISSRGGNFIAEL